MELRTHSVEQSPLPEVSAYTPEDFLGSLNSLESKHAPPKLFVSGDSELCGKGRRVAVVGSRRASEAGLRRARKLTRLLVEARITVVSGLAEGVDTAAHTAAIELGGRTIAVLGTALNRVYPRSNAALYHSIVRDHAAVSQFRIGSIARRFHFPLRNRTMALLTDATVVVEAGQRSGTRHQGWEALRLGRQLAFLESLASRRIPWIQEQLDCGAWVLGSENVEDWITDIPERAIDDDLPF